MGHRIRTASLLAAFLAVASIATSAQAGTTPPQAMTVNGAYVVLGKPPGTGPFEFNYGWHNSAQFASPAAGYWVGIYQETYPKHYLWASETMFDVPTAGTNTVESMELQWRDAVGGLPPGDYKINFFVRSSAVPGTNVAEITLPFTVK